MGSKQIRMKRRSFLKSLAALVISVSIAKELGALDPIKGIEDPKEKEQKYVLNPEWKNAEFEISHRYIPVNFYAPDDHNKLHAFIYRKS